jgi:hypothetical protein
MYTRRPRRNTHQVKSIVAKRLVLQPALFSHNILKHSILGLRLSLTSFVKCVTRCLLATIGMSAPNSLLTTQTRSMAWP